MPPDLKPVVGFPTPETVMVSKTDYADMIAYTNALRDWMRAAAGCLDAR